MLTSLALLLAAALSSARGAPESNEKVDFLRRFPHYGYRDEGGRQIDAIWKQDISPRLAAEEHYLDYTGSSIYLNSQLEQSLKALEAGVFGNPHSTNPSSQRTERLVEGLRGRVLALLGASPDEYDVVWTRSGTGALRMVGETFPWSADSGFAYLVSNHNSVLGIREYARLGGAAFGSVTEEALEAWLAGGPLATNGSSSSSSGSGGSFEGSGSGSAREEQSKAGRRELRAAQLAAAGEEPGSLRRAAAGEAAEEGPDGNGSQAADKEAAWSLFAFPAQDNFAGVLYPLSWVRGIQAKSTRSRRWKVLLDAAAFLPTHPLNLTETPADYVCISFYKLFGAPTGVGALVARKENLVAARKRYWGGGSVFLATSTLDWKHFRPAGPERYEDGTLPFLNIMALQQGLDVFERLGGPVAIHRHTSALRVWMHEQLAALKHANGAPLLRLLGRHDWANSSEAQASTFNFQLLKPDGKLFSYRTASEVLAEAGFSIRCGCTCNPGACYGLLGVRDEEVKAAAEAAHDNFSDWEWVWVHREEAEIRPAAGPSLSPAPAQHFPDGGSEGSGSRRRVRLPLGSLRASLGYMARFEDARALVRFLKAHYTDRTSDDATREELAASMAAAGLELGGGGELGAQRRKERLQRAAAPARDGPGWC